MASRGWSAGIQVTRQSNSQKSVRESIESFLNRTNSRKWWLPQPNRFVIETEMYAKQVH